jgi:hypothetical protein
LLGACGSVEDKSPDAAVAVDADIEIDADTIDAPPGLRPWGTPVKLTELADATNGTGDASMTPDLLTIVFRSARPSGMGGGDLYTSHRATASAAWPTPALIAELNSTDDDAHPWIAPDGLRIYFSSTRPGGLGSYDIYTSVRATATSAWGAPALVTDLNAGGTDLELALASGGLVGVLTSDRGGTRAPYLVSRATATGAFSSVSAIASGAGCLDSTIANGGLSLYCSHDGALWMATRPDLTSTFGTPTEVLIGANLGDGWVSDDQNTALVTIDDENAVAAIYMVTREP